MDERLKQCCGGAEGVARMFGLDLYSWPKYRLDTFERLPGNEAAWRCACHFIYTDENLENGCELFENEDDQNAWYEDFDRGHYFLTLAGDCGRGKTRLAVGIGIWAIEHNDRMAVYYQVPDLLSQMRATFSDNDTGKFKKILETCKKVETLILDDLGMQKNTDWALEQLDSIIDHRYINQLDTVFTTNLLPDELPPRIRSRLKEGEYSVLEGLDYREIIAKRRAEKRRVIGEAERIISKEGNSNDKHLLIFQRIIQARAGTGWQPLLL